MALSLGCARDRGTAQRADEVVVLWEAGPGELDPRFALSAYSDKVGRLLFSRLVDVDNEASEPRFDLALSLEQPSPTTYVFRLREDATFHDGTPVTAADIVWTFKSLGDPALKSPYGGVAERIDSVEALGPHQVRFRLKEVHAPFITDLDMGIVPKHLTEATGRFSGPPIGSGPFALESMEGPERVTLVRHRQWHGAAPDDAVSRVRFRAIGDANSRVLALMGGSGDILQNEVSPLLVPVLERREDLQVMTGPSIGLTYLGFNLRDPVLGRQEVREAIAHAIDRRAIIRHKYAGRAREATGLLAPGHWAYEPDVVSYPYDPARAMALLDKAGFRDPDGEGPLPRLSLTYKTTTNRFRLAVARVLAHYLRQVGIDVEVKAYEWGTFFHDIKSGNFQLYTLQWPVLVEPDMYGWIFHSERVPTAENRGKGGNRGAYSNPEVDALIEAGRRSVNRDERRRIYSGIQRILARELPYVHLWHEDNIAVIRRSVKGWKVLPNARFAALAHVRKEGP